MKTERGMSDSNLRSFAHRRMYSVKCRKGLYDLTFCGDDIPALSGASLMEAHKYLSGGGHCTNTGVVYPTINPEQDNKI